jgi:hypothetical protein
MDMSTLINALNQNFNQVQSQDRRKVVTDEDGFDRILIGKKEDGKYAIKVSSTGYDVDTATDDQLVMSSDWNMWKIITRGNTGYNTIYRAGTLALDSTTYIGYEHRTIIDIGLPSGVVIPSSSDVLINITSSFGVPFANAGFFWHDGTNIVWRRCSYYLNSDTGKLTLVQRFRMLGGSHTVNPSTYVQRGLKWSICNQTQAVPGGGGGAGSYDTKYYYLDTVTIDKSGNITTALESTTVQFLVDEWKTWL